MSEMAGLPLDPDAIDPDDERPVIEGYDTIEYLGAGGMGAVWRAKQASTNRDVALKIIRGARFASPRSRARFEREVELAARLEHPGIARVYESGLHRGIYFYAMELVQGVHLDEYVRTRGLNRRQILQLFRETCDAVVHAHQQGVLHRDLKPSNIIVTDDGHPHIVDFGLAGTLDSDVPMQTLSQEGELAGTLAYMPPEQAMGRLRDVDVRSEVYSLTAILFELPTGQTPHDQSGTRFEVQQRTVERETRLPRSLGLKLDNELEAILVKGLAQKPDQRYPSVSHLSADIDSYLTGNPVSARPLTMWYFVRKWVHRHQLPVGLGAIVLVAGIAAATFAYVNIVEARKSAETERANAEHALYLTKISYAKTEINNGNIAQAKELLNSCVPHERRWEWYWLSYLADQSVLTVGAPGVRNRNVAWTADGRALLTLGDDGTLRTWDAATGDLRREQFIRDTPPGTQSAISWDSRRLAIVDRQGRLSIWRLDVDGIVPLSLTVDPDIVSLDIAPGRDTVIYLTRQGDVVIMDATSGKELVRSTSHDTNASVGFSCDGKAAFSVGADAAIWSAIDGKLERRWSLEGKFATSGFMRESGNVFYTGHRDGLVRIWTGVEWEDVQIPDGQGKPIRSIAVTDTGQVLAHSDDGWIWRWEEGTHDPVKVYLGHEDRIWDMRLDLATARLASMSSNAVKVWELNGPQFGHSVRTTPELSLITSLSINEASGMLIAGSANGWIAVIVPEDPTELSFQGHADGVMWAGLNEDRDTIVSVGADGSIKYWNLNGGPRNRDVVIGDNRVVHVAASPGHERLAVCTTSATIVVSMNSGRHVAALPGAGCARFVGGSVNLALVPALHPRRVELWKVDEAALLNTDVEFGGPIVDLAADEDGRSLFALASDGVVAACRTDGDGLHVTQQFDVAEAVTGLVAFPDGQRVAVTGRGVVIYDTRTGTNILRLSDADVITSAVSSDGTTLIAAGWQEVATWSVPSR